MENTPTAPAEAPKAPESEATPTNTEQTPAPEINAEQVAKYLGTDTETLGKFQKFVDANGKFDSAFSKMKTSISNPQPAPAPEAPKSEPQPQVQPTEPVYKAPEGSITAQEFMAKQYFQALAGEEKYAPIAEGIANGDYLKEMAAFGINATNPDGSINDQKVRMYLDLKAQTVPAKPTGAEPDASNAPTVNYVEVGENIDNIDQAYAVLMQPSHPKREMAKEYIKTHLNPQTKKEA